jgi:hypothetical protein
LAGGFWLSLPLVSLAVPFSVGMSGVDPVFVPVCVAVLVVLVPPVSGSAVAVPEADIELLVLMPAGSSLSRTP